MTVTWSRGAMLDQEEALDFYLQRDARLAAQLLDETEAAITRIVSSPLQFPVIRGTIRRARVQRFPFDIYFQLSDVGCNIPPL